MIQVMLIHTKKHFLDLALEDVNQGVEELKHDGALDGLEDDLEKDLESTSKGHALLPDRSQSNTAPPLRKLLYQSNKDFQ